MRTKRIALKLDPEYRDKLRVIAEVGKHSMAAELRVLIDEKCKKILREGDAN